MSDVVIVGGGPAGAAAAITLAGGGIRATILERTRGAEDALCGGFLSWRTLDTLASLGIAADALNPHPITHLRLFAGSHTSEAPLPRPARAVSRRRLDALLLASAEARGAGVERGVAVRSIDGSRVHCADGATITARRLLLASGKHDIRGAARDAERDSDPTLGLRVRLPHHARLDRLLANAIELHLFDRGYAGIALQEDGSANVCLAVRRSRLREAGDPPALIDALAREMPRLAERLAHMPADATIDAIANVPYGWRALRTRPGVFRLGDQAAVIPSLAGEGMGIAMASGIRAAQAINGGRDAPQYQSAFAAAAARPLAIAGVVRVLAEHQTGARALVAGARFPLAARAIARLTRINESQVDAAPAAQHMPEHGASQPVRGRMAQAPEP